MHNSEIATFAGGCFWCMEAVFIRLKGVCQVTSGYTGGTVKHPTYEQVCTGTTGHAEAVQIGFDPSVISYATLLDVFFHMHDPTQLNKQGHDTGTQYRSVIFYHSLCQRTIAEQAVVDIGKSKIYSQKIVTELVAATEFYPAEEYHKNYYALHSQQPYCQYVIEPKITKLFKQYNTLVQ